MSEDTTFKQVVTRYPVDAAKFFAPRLVEAHGEPLEVQEVSPEIFNPDREGRSGFLDIALKFTWADGTSDIILLIEHWSDRSKICLRRAHRYLAELLLRHPEHRVYPVIFVTDPSSKEIQSSLSYEVAGRHVLSLDFDVVRLSPQQKDAIVKSRNLVSAIFWVLVPKGLVS